jgi:hypothetical protein
MAVRGLGVRLTPSSSMTCRVQVSRGASLGWAGGEGGGGGGNPYLQSIVLVMPWAAMAAGACLLPVLGPWQGGG